MKMNKNRKTLKMPVRYLMNAVLVVLLFLALSYMTGNMLSTYQNKVLMTVGINIILAVSLNVATGYLGQLPLGHAGFMAVGAYTCALFTKYSNLPSGVAFVVGLVLACIVAGLFGVLIGIPALRLTGDYLAILTLGFGEIIRITLNNIDDVLGFKLFYGAKGHQFRIQICTSHVHIKGTDYRQIMLFHCISPDSFSFHTYTIQSQSQFNLNKIYFS